MYWLAVLLESTTSLATVSPSPIPDFNGIVPQLLGVCPASSAGTDILTLSTPFLFGVTAVGLASALRKWCYRTLGPMFRGEVAIQQNHKLITSGPYAWVRHPGYSGALLFFVGSVMVFFSSGTYIRECVLSRTVRRFATAECSVAAIGQCVAALQSTGWAERAVMMWIATWASLITIIVYIIFTRLDWEDEILRNAFPKEWVAWSKRTPYQVVPYVL